jgi:glucose/arabinose dehydrogenase
MKLKRLHALTAAYAFAPLLALPAVAEAAMVANPSTSPQCMANTAFFNPQLPPSIVLPAGFKASVFVSGLNMPTAVAFLGNASSFQVFVLEFGHGLPSVCNDETLWPGGVFDKNNPFTPDILVFNQNGRLIRGPLGKPTSTGGGFQPSGPAVDIAFVNGLSGGRLFATDSNQSTHQHNGNNNSSRIVTVNHMTGVVTPFISNLPTGDHPTEQLAFKGGWLYWSQGSTTNSGVVGLDNGGGQNQSDIPCQDITLSKNLFDSGGGKLTSGYSPFNTQNPGGNHKGVLQLGHG